MWCCSHKNPYATLAVLMLHTLIYVCVCVSLTMHYIYCEGLLFLDTLIMETVTMFVCIALHCVCYITISITKHIINHRHQRIQHIKILFNVKNTKPPPRTQLYICSSLVACRESVSTSKVIFSAALAKHHEFQSRAICLIYHCYTEY